MDNAKRRGLIRSQAVKKKESGDMVSTATVASNPYVKRKSVPKGDRQAKKPNVSLEPIVGLMAEGKTITPVKHEAGKGFIKHNKHFFSLFLKIIVFILIELLI